MKKTINKKVKIKKSNKELVKSTWFNNKKNIILVVLFILIIVLLLFLFLFNFNDTIKCTKTIGDESVLIENKSTTIKLSRNKIKEVNLNKTLEFSSEYISYIDIVKETLEKEYENLNLDSHVLREDNKLVINIKSNKKYLLDNIDVSLSDETVNINIMSDYSFENIDFSQRNLSKQIKSLFNENEYICK